MKQIIAFESGRVIALRVIERAVQKKGEGDMKRLLAIILCVDVMLIAAAEIPELPEEQGAEERQTSELMGSEQDAIRLLKNIIKSNHSFSIKISNPLLPGKIRSWQERGMVSYPTKLTPWTVFKRDVHQLGAYLEELLAKDPQKNQYYHIDALRKNHALYKTLQEMERKLKSYESKIENTPQPLRLSKESLESLQRLINFYGTQFYQNKLLSQITTTLKSFEKKAQELRTKEEQLQKSAQKKSAAFESSFENDFFESPRMQQPEEEFNLESLGLDDEFIASFFE